MKNILLYAIKNSSCFPLLREKLKSVSWRPYRGGAGLGRVWVQGTGAWAALWARCTQEPGWILEPGIPHMQGKVLALCIKPGSEFSADLFFHIWPHLYQGAEAFSGILPEPLEEIEIAVCITTIHREALSFLDFQESWALFHRRLLVWPCSGGVKRFSYIRNCFFP